MDLYNEFFSIIEAFEKNDMAYAVMGGFAMAFHDKPRFTEDIDILVKTADLEKCGEILDGLDFFSSTDPHHFLDTKLTLYRYVKTFNNDYLILDLISGEERKFERMLHNSINYEWQKGKVSVVNRDDLILLKEMRNSEQDKVDIMNLRNDEKKDSN